MFWVMSTSLLHRCLHAQAPELMGPCFRRDDEREKAVIAPIFANTNLRSRRAFRTSFAVDVPPSSIRGRRAAQEGAGNAGRPERPRPRVQRKAHELETTVTPESPGIPRAMVLTVSFVLFPVTGLCCHRHRWNLFRQLDASVGASEPHDFAVRKAKRLRQCAPCVHRIPPRVRDDREPPLCGTRRQGICR